MSSTYGSPSRRRCHPTARQPTHHTDMQQQKKRIVVLKSHNINHDTVVIAGIKYNDKGGGSTHK